MLNTFYRNISTKLREVDQAYLYKSTKINILKVLESIYYVYILYTYLPFSKLEEEPMNLNVYLFFSGDKIQMRSNTKKTIFFLYTKKVVLVENRWFLNVCVTASFLEQKPADKRKPAVEI